MFFRKDKKQLEEIKEMMEAPQEEAEELPTVEREVSAPLFVKVDKYKSIIASIQELKLFVSGTKQLFTVLHEIENVRADALNILRATVQRLERSIVEIDSELVRPRGVNIVDVTESTEATHIESSLTELQKQLMELKRELQQMK